MNKKLLPIALLLISSLSFASEVPNLITCNTYSEGVDQVVVDYNDRSKKLEITVSYSDSSEGYMNLILL